MQEKLWTWNQSSEFITEKEVRFLIRKTFGYKKLCPLKMVTTAAYKTGEIINIQLVRISPSISLRQRRKALGQLIEYGFAPNLKKTRHTCSE